MVTRVPIDPETVIWARERLRLSRAQAALKLQCTEDDLVRIETDLKMPSATLFRKMADVYLLPEATLLGLVPVGDLPLPKDFRSFEGAAVSLSYDTIAAIKKVEARQASLQHLSEIDEDVVAPEIPLRLVTENPEALGAHMRAIIGFPIVDQLRMAPPKALYRWRLLIEDIGVSVYVEPFGDDDARGVSLFFNDFPAIIIDQKEKHHGARLFTLMHEYAHLLIRQTGISNFSPRNRIEKFCNAFASAFLMPREALEIVFTVPSRGTIRPTIDQLSEAATRLCTSISQVAMRLETLGIAPTGYYISVVRSLNPPAPRVKTKGQWRWTYYSQFGHKLPATVIGSLDRRKINAVEAARMLEASPSNIPAVKRTLEERRVEFGNAG